jgi:CRISPR-associated protein Csm3
MAQFLANIILKGQIECLTGLHIGGSKDKFEIGGVDNPVIRDPKTNYPFIPGSSLKGKMRTLLEFDLGLVKADEKGNYPPSNEEPVATIFGSSAEEKQEGPTRLIVRDAFPSQATVEMWNSLDTELNYTEYKAENTIDRMTSAANPRFIERVVKGSIFEFEMTFSIYDTDQDKAKEYFQHIIQSLKLLEHSALGGGGSRGSGQIKIKIAEPYLVKRDDYKNNTEVYKNSVEVKPDFNKELCDLNDDFYNDKIKL